MAGAGLKITHQILGALATGPKSKVELRKACGWSPFGQNKALDAHLQKMRVAGLAAPLSKAAGGLWQMKPGLEICSCCHGRGVTRLDEPEEG